MNTQLQRRLGRLEGARLRQRPAPADARQRSMRAVIERVGVPGLVAIGAGVQIAIPYNGRELAAPVS